jgi:hypothetical protein
MKSGANGSKALGLPVAGLLAILVQAAIAGVFVPVRLPSLWQLSQIAGVIRAEESELTRRRCPAPAHP